MKFFLSTLKLIIIAGITYALIRVHFFEQFGIFLITGLVPYTSLTLTPNQMYATLAMIALLTTLYISHSIKKHHQHALPALINTTKTSRPSSPARRRTQAVATLTESPSIKRNNSLRPQLKLFKKKMLTLINSFGQLRQRRRVSDETSA